MMFEITHLLALHVPQRRKVVRGVGWHAGHNARSLVLLDGHHRQRVDGRVPAHKVYVMNPQIKQCSRDEISFSEHATHLVKGPDSGTAMMSLPRNVASTSTLPFSGVSAW